MSILPLRAPALCWLVLLLQACAATPEDGSPPVPTDKQRPQPELTLHLPDQDCLCEPQDSATDYTFLEKGLSALAAGEHIEAVTYFQRYQRLESSPEADWEAGIAIAYDSMLTQSPFYDPVAALQSYRRLSPAAVDPARVHKRILLLRDALATFAAMQSQIEALDRDNRRLAQDLAKREEALKRLRELTLGQKAGSP